MTHIVGGTCLSAGVHFLALAPGMFALQVRLKLCLMSAVCWVFTLTIAAAFLCPSKRTIAIRALGVMLFP
jgi:hypothetical protein